MIQRHIIAGPADDTSHGQVGCIGGGNHLQVHRTGILNGYIVAGLSNKSSGIFRTITIRRHNGIHQMDVMDGGIFCQDTDHTKDISAASVSAHGTVPKGIVHLCADLVRYHLPDSPVLPTLNTDREIPEGKVRDLTLNPLEQIACQGIAVDLAGTGVVDGVIPHVFQHMGLGVAGSIPLYFPDTICVLRIPGTIQFAGKGKGLHRIRINRLAVCIGIGLQEIPLLILSPDPEVPVAGITDEQVIPVAEAGQRIVEGDRQDSGSVDRCIASIRISHGVLR